MCRVQKYYTEETIDKQFHGLLVRKLDSKSSNSISNLSKHYPKVLKNVCVSMDAGKNKLTIVTVHYNGTKIKININIRFSSNFKPFLHAYTSKI